MHQHRLSISVPLEGIPLSEHAAVLREMEALGYADVWSLEVDGTDAFTPLALAAQTTGLRLGTAIANVFTRGPATLAQTAAGLSTVVACLIGLNWCLAGVAWASVVTAVI